MMKHILLLLALVPFVHSGQRNVLVEMFTNSHCGVCPGAHSAISAYASTSPNASRVRYIYYHTTFPYSDDPLSLANTTEPNARNTYYNGPTSTPNTFFDGVNQGRTYSSFGSGLDARMAVAAPFEIILSGTKNGSSVTVTASILQTGTVSSTDLVLHMIAVENTTYVGRNGVSPQNFVMRKMITPAAGDPFVMGANVSKQVTHSATLNNITSMSAVGVVVFLQSVSTREVFQSEYISHGTLTGIGTLDAITPKEFLLEQNYPNPFNPTTTISYQLPASGMTTLILYDALGREAATLVNEVKEAGRYSATFDASQLASGTYYARLISNGKIQMRKLSLIK